MARWNHDLDLIQKSSKIRRNRKTSLGIWCKSFLQRIRKFQFWPFIPKWRENFKFFSKSKKTLGLDPIKILLCLYKKRSKRPNKLKLKIKTKLKSIRKWIKTKREISNRIKFLQKKIINLLKKINFWTIFKEINFWNFLGKIFFLNFL